VNWPQHRFPSRNHYVVFLLLLSALAFLLAVGCGVAWLVRVGGLFLSALAAGERCTCHLDGVDLRLLLGTVAGSLTLLMLRAEWTRLEESV